MSLDLSRMEVMDDDMAELLRGKSEAQRLAMGNRLWVYARDLLTAVLRSEHPEWTDQEIQQETARRLSHGAV